MKLLKKISVKTVVGDKKVIREIADNGDGKEVIVMRIGGVVTSHESGDSEFGTWIALIGNFKAFNASTGEECRGGKAFVPEEFSSQVVAALEDGSTDISFVLDIAVKASPTAAIGYEYISIPVVQEAVSDPLGALFDSAPTLTLIPQHPKRPQVKKGKPKAP